ncbi:uncharacterized protein LOC108023858 [Drosophila biarmipes]|uniref:uncharacterized protein LOC108023858 n=1 Tax=Drosophila biarmipes TaxID=125945 RepID=UPI001CDAA745|nr:uncharacterized protein LOC108023858 [Drosophila biarmipes]
MFQKWLSIFFCVCCSIGILSLDASPIPVESSSRKASNSDAGLEAMDHLESSANPLTREARESKEVTPPSEVLAPAPDEDYIKARKKRSLGGLAPGLRLFPVNDGYGNPAKMRLRTKSSKRPKDKTTKKAKNSTKMVRFRAEGDKKETTGAPARPMELTISIHKKDKFGQWVYNPWGATFGKVWQDTRFHVNHQSRMPRLHIDSDPGMDYYPDDEGISTVCLGRSTIYNKPRIMNYLTGKMYREPHSHRPIWLALRRQLFKLARSEECRTSNLTEWLPYQECALRRNQRMEYMIPQYPRHQM